jgi:nucleoside-diphosphate-sugar epimerase
MSQGVDFLVFGARGYFGSHLVKTLQAQKRSFVASNARVEFRDQVEKEIDLHKPKYVLNAAGLAGTPNIVRKSFSEAQLPDFIYFCFNASQSLQKYFLNVCKIRIVL